MNAIVSETRRCDVCHRHAPLDEECHHCRRHKAEVIQGIRWARLEMLPSAKPEQNWTPLAILDGLEISHSGRGYWVIQGRVPLAVARLLYADPVGRDVIRVNGHCGCPAPEAPWVAWYMPSGRAVCPLKEMKVCEDGLAKSPETSYAKICRKVLDENDFHDDPASIGAAGFVETYHIDGNLGLRVFVDIWRAAGSAPSCIQLPTGG